MRIVSGILFVFGLCLLVFAALLVPEGTGARVSQTVSGYIEGEAREYRENGAETRGERRWGRFMSGLFSVNDGILRGAEVDLETVVTASPVGWTQRNYVTADGARITGAEVRMTGIVSTTTNSILVDFERISDSAFAARATYENGTTLVSLFIRTDTDRIRDVEGAVHSGTFRPAGPRSGGVAVLGGMQVVQNSRIEQNLLTNETRPATFAHYTVDFDGMIELALITNGTHEDALSVLDGLDLAMIRASLPGYDAGPVAAN